MLKIPTTAINGGQIIVNARNISISNTFGMREASHLMEIHRLVVWELQKHAYFRTILARRLAF